MSDENRKEHRHSDLPGGRRTAWHAGRAAINKRKTKCTMPYKFYKCATVAVLPCRWYMHTPEYMKTTRRHNTCFVLVLKWHCTTGGGSDCHKNMYKWWCAGERHRALCLSATLNNSLSELSNKSASARINGSAEARRLPSIHTSECMCSGLSLQTMFASFSVCVCVCMYQSLSLHQRALRIYCCSGFAVSGCFVHWTCLPEAFSHTNSVWIIVLFCAEFIAAEQKRSNATNNKCLPRAVWLDILLLALCFSCCRSALRSFRWNISALLFSIVH